MSTRLPVYVALERRFTVGTERVFDAWLDAARTASWLFPEDSDEVVRAEVDAREGGDFRFVVRRDGQPIEVQGRYVEIDRPCLLVFTWTSAFDDGEDRVILEVTGDCETCDLTLTCVLRQEAVRSAAAIEGAWARRLDRLATTLRRHIMLAR